MEHIEGIECEVPGIDLRRVTDVAEFFHGHGEGAQVAQDTRFDEGHKVSEGKASDFGTFPNVCERVGFDLVGASKLDFAPLERFGIILFVEGFVDIEIDVDVGRSRSP